MIELSDPAETIRSGAVAARLKADDPNCHLVYLSAFPELVGNWVDEPLRYDAGSILRCQMDSFQVVYNLDLDGRACAITNLMSAEMKKGFYLRQGRALPLDEDSEAVFLQRLMPGTETQEKYNPLKQLFGLCGLSYHGERARLKLSHDVPGDVDKAAVIGLNVCGDMRSGGKLAWDARYWSETIRLLADRCLPVRLVGAPATRAIQEMIAREAGLDDKACASWSDVQAAVSGCDVIVSPPGAVAEMALALGRRVVLLAEGGAGSLDEMYLHGLGCTVPGHDQSGITLADIFPNEIVDAVCNEMASLGQTPEPRPTEAALDAALAGRSETARRRRPPTS